MSMVSILEHHGWHEWLCKSNFSFLIGASHPQELLSEAAHLGYSSLALNDYDGVYGLARAYRALRSLPAENTCRLHYGAEIHLAEDHARPLLLQDTLVLIAQSWQGYHNLCRLLTESHRLSKRQASLSLAQLLAADVADLALIQPMRGRMRQAREPNLAEWAALRDHFRGRFYFAVSRHLHPAEDHWIARTLTYAKRLASPCLLSQDVFFHTAQRKKLSDLLHAIRHNLPMPAASAYFFPNCERYLHRLPALAARYQSLPIYAAALEASAELAASCQFDMGTLRYRYPQEMIPPSYTAQGYLEELSWQAAQSRFGAPLPAKITAILSHELDLIAELQFADYFLTVWDIVRWARAQGILCQGRGSAANSAVCFVLGITAVDPTLFDLLFERFISMERGDPPDIDVDFEHERREEVLQYIYQRYGRQRAAMVANVITFRTKGALRAVGKALAIPELVLDKAAGLTHSRLLRGHGSQAVLQHLATSLPPDELPAEALPWTLWAEMSDALRGFPRHLGIHSGGFILAERSLDWLVAQEPATMLGRTVIQWCKEDIEALGFFKIDLLALGMLTAVRKAFASIADCYGVKLDLASLPVDDPSTYSMIQRADTVGTFQIESRAQMSMLPRLKPRCFYDLVIEIAIIRPGPIQGNVIHPYLKRRSGEEPVTFPDERLRPILARTLGVAIFQEQAMRIAIAVGKFTPGEANELRKHIGAWSIKDLDRNLNPWLHKLAAGMQANGCQEEFIAQVLGQMRGFADYGFPESHAVSFALIAYASAYLKCHYPAAFFTAVLNSQPMGFYTPHSLLQAAARDGVRTLPVCVQHSTWDHQLERLPSSSPVRPPLYGIRLGFRLVRGLRRAGAERLQAIRQTRGGTLSSLRELCEGGGLYRSDLTALAAAQAFQSLGLARLEALWQAEAAPFAPLLEEEENPLVWPAESPWESVERDFAATETSLGTHPATLMRDEYWNYKVPLSTLVAAKDLAHTKDASYVVIFGMILVKQSPPSAKGMVFLTLEDESGFINLVCTPPVFRHYYSEIERASFLCIRGKLQKTGEQHSILVSDVYAPSPREASIASLHPKHEPLFQSTQASAPHAAGQTHPRVPDPRHYH